MGITQLGCLPGLKGCIGLGLEVNGVGVIAVVCRNCGF